MNFHETIELIRGFRQKRQNWLTMADLVREVSSTDAWVGHYSSNADWLKAAAELSGYHPTVLRRMLRVRDFLKRLEEQKNFVLPKESNIPLASLEILERMFPLAPDRTKELLGRAVKGEITLREVQKEYQDILKQTPHQLRPVEAFYSRAIKAVTTSMELLSGKAKFEFIREFSGLYTTIDLIAIKYDQTGTNDYDGFAFEYSAIGDKNILNIRHGALRRAVYNSQFFGKYWVIFPEDAGIEHAEWLANALRPFGLYNVGIAVLKDHPESSMPEELWHFSASLIRPSVDSPSKAGFFPSDDEYTPKWKHLLLKHIDLQKAETIE